MAAITRFSLAHERLVVVSWLLVTVVGLVPEQRVRQVRLLPLSPVWTSLAG